MLPGDFCATYDDSPPASRVSNQTAELMQVVISVPPVEGRRNDYQALFYGALETSGIALWRDFTVFSLASIWKNRHSVDIAHIHWAPAPSNSFHATFDIVAFFLKLLLCRVCGIKVIWTAHNLMPHDRHNFLFEYTKRMVLVHLSHLIIVHFEGAREELARWFCASKRKIAVMRHGLYAGTFPDTVSREAARRALSIPSNQTVFLCYGSVRPYKNIETLYTSISVAR